MRYLLITTCVFALSGCAVTSFAPPVVNLQRELTFTGTQSTFNAICSPKPRGVEISQDVDGALRLISNFVLTYRCQRDRAAEGRQYFEVPSMLATIGGATAAAFGAPAGVAIGTGAASAALGQGKSYYAPRDKAVVFNDGVAALLCVQNAAVGVDPFTLKALSAAQDDSSGTTTPTTAPPPVGSLVTGIAALVPPVSTRTAGVEITYGRQYFEMIRSALFSVEEIMAQRLSAAGTPFDAAGVIAEIEKLNKTEEAQATETATTTAEEKGADAKEAAGAEALSGRTWSQARLSTVSDARVGRTVIKIDELQTKLDKCVISAKV